MPHRHRPGQIQKIGYTNGSTALPDRKTMRAKSSSGMNASANTMPTTTPAIAIPRPFNCGLLEILEMAINPRMMPGMNPKGQMMSEAHENASDVIAKLDLCATPFIMTDGFKCGITFEVTGLADQHM